MKVVLKNQQDDSICLIFTDGYWFLPEILASNQQQEEQELKQLTGLKEVKITSKSSHIMQATCPDDTQENLDILIGWFDQEDAIRSIEEKEKPMLKEALT